MSRSDYYDDGDDQWGLIRWRGAVTSAINGVRGQDFLKEMVDALDALPERRLISENLVRTGDENLQVCAIGAVGIARRMDMSKLDPDEYDQVAERFGIASALAREIVWMNDEWYNRVTPERRWLMMRRWAVSQIKGWHNPESDLMLQETG